MAKSTQEVVFEGWLTKSPPTKRIWRARWRRRWFSLTTTGELPGQFILTYYTDRNCRKLKGVINLDRCEQVDLGLKLEERKLKFDHVFDIKTPTRTYYLAAESEAEMKSWVNCICKVCGLKSNDDDDLHISTVNSADVEIIEELDLDRFPSTPLISPVSTSPYIPISECITGKSPVLDPKDLKSIFEYNKKLNEHEDHKQYINYVNDILDPQFYDCPRKLAPPKANEKNISPLQSPTDSESVFTDDDWNHNISNELNVSRTTRPSNSSADVDIIATQKFTKTGKLENAPPRPPKPQHISPAPCYLNLTPTKIAKESDEAEKTKVLTDDMYDFPRSHQVETETKGSLMRKHCYNNAAPVACVEGTIFKYDISPKPSTSTSVFKYDLDDSQDEPASPHSQTSSTAAYSNLPSPLLAETQLMPPPKVNRGLKPKRKLSDSSTTEPSSPRMVPSVDRKLKPTTPLQDRNRKGYDEEGRKVRAAPSPTPPLFRSHESLLSSHQNDDDYQLSTKMQYLDLDLEGSTGPSEITTRTLPSKTNGGDTVYKKVDFMKTSAFKQTKNDLEQQRKKPVSFKK